LLGGRCLFGGGVGNRLPLLRLLWPSSSNLWANVRAVASRYSTYHLGGECNSGSPSNFTRRVSPLVSDVDELRASADLKHRGTTGVVCSTSLGASGAGLHGASWPSSPCCWGSGATASTVVVIQFVDFTGRGSVSTDVVEGEVMESALLQLAALLLVRSPKTIRPLTVAAGVVATSLVTSCFTSAVLRRVGVEPAVRRARTSVGRGSSCCGTAGEELRGLPGVSAAVGAGKQVVELEG